MKDCVECKSNKVRDVWNGVDCNGSVYQQIHLNTIKNDLKSDIL